MEKPKSQHIPVFAITSGYESLRSHVRRLFPIMILGAFYRVLEQQSMEISARNSCLLRGRGDVAARFRQEPDHSVALEDRDHPFLGLQEASLGSDPHRAELLQVKGEMGDFDLTAGREDHRPLDAILQLAQVA